MILLGMFSTQSIAKPLFKPMKYYGPIPKKSFSIRIGFIGGATNQEMWDALKPKIKNPDIIAYSNDFSNAFVVDGTFTAKLHPNFGVRTNLSLGLLRSDSHGTDVPNIGDPHPLRVFKRKFNVDLFSLAGDAIYYFTDASVSEFQPYIGGGFSLWVPHATYKESYVDKYTESDSTVTGPDFKNSKWSLEAGIQGVIGVLYYVSNSFAVTGEARYHVAQSTFTVRAPTNTGDYKDVNFIVNYTGFVISIGILRAF